MQGYRAALLRFDADEVLQRVDDALVIVEAGRIVEADAFAAVAARHPDVAWVDWRPWVLAPGFVDTHVHFPQLDVIGSPADGLLPWLENYTFPHEARFADPAYAAAMAEVFLDELLRNGVTTAMVYCSSHRASAEAFFAASLRRGLRMVAGKCLMDSNSPDPVRDETASSLVESQALIERWHGRGRLGYALTPRFAASCSEAQMRGAAELADAYPGTWVQTHVAENHDEIAWVAQLFPQARSYLDVYDRLGLLRERSMYAHCIYLDTEDRARLAASGASAAVCPTSNLFLGSGLFDFGAAAQAGFQWGLACDVGGGTSFSPFRTMLAAYEVARLGALTLAPQTLWYRHTLGAARAMGLGSQVGNVAPGYDADFIALDDRATPLLARRSGAAASLAEWLFSLIVLGDDRVVVQRVAGGVPLAGF
ncbi:MAG: guanine deaminase [Burkholderiales bacterium]|nr:guanine deaminase [Burkholderiales bacterium]